MNNNKTVKKIVNKKSHVCDVCKKGFGYKSLLIRHMLVHTGKKDFQCYACLKKFAHKQVLTRHMVTHTKEKNFKCKFCEKKFTRKVLFKVSFDVYSDLSIYFLT